jgi:alkylated DNA repair dioxygenase AlkB
LLLMWGRSQRTWQHSLPKTRSAVGRRINLTFRDVHASS